MTDPEFLAKAMRAQIQGSPSAGSCLWCIHYTPTMRPWCHRHPLQPETRNLAGKATSCDQFTLGPNHVIHND